MRWFRAWTGRGARPTSRARWAFGGKVGRAPMPDRRKAERRGAGEAAEGREALDRCAGFARGRASAFVLRNYGATRGCPSYFPRTMGVWRKCRSGTHARPEQEASGMGGGSDKSRAASGDKGAPASPPAPSLRERGRAGRPKPKCDKWVRVKRDRAAAKRVRESWARRFGRPLTDEEIFLAEMGIPPRPGPWDWDQ